MAKIQVLEGPMSGSEFELEKEVIFVGRSPANDIQFHDGGVSRKHLKIFSVESCYFIEDLKAKNGTKINGEPLDAGIARLITENDRIQLGTTIIRLDGIGVNKPPMTLENIEPYPPEEPNDARSATAYPGEERRARALREMKFISDIVQAVGEGSSTNQLLERVAESILDIYPRVDQVSAFLFDDGKKRMEEIASRSKPDRDRKKTSYSRAILDQVVQEGKIVTLYLKTDAARDRFTSVQDTLAFMAVICLPLMSGHKTRGAIYIEGFQENNPVRKEDLLLLKTISHLVELTLRVDNPARDTAPYAQSRKEPEAK
jgi:hypothetical protein